MADIFNEDGKYNKTDWESGDRITANKLNRIEMAIEQINDNDNQRHVEADGRLDSLEAGLTETKDKVDNIDMAYKTADTVLTNRVNSVETSYKAADTTLNNRVNSVETAYKTSETNLTNKFNNLNTAYQNAVSNLTAKFNSLETAYKAADTKMTNNINNLDAAYKAADVEIQNSIPTKISQLENDANYNAGLNLIPNSDFEQGTAGWKTTSLADSNIDFLDIYSREPYISWNNIPFRTIELAGNLFTANGPINSGLDSPKMFLNFNEHYSFSTYLAGAFIDEAVVDFYGTSDDGSSVHLGEVWRGPVGDNTQYGAFETWTKVEFTITTPNQDGSPVKADGYFLKFWCVNHDNNGGTGTVFYFMLSCPCLVKGVTPIDWVPGKCTNIPPQPGDYWNDGTPIVNSSGLMHVGKYIHFHGNDDTGETKIGSLLAQDKNLWTDMNFLPGNNDTRDLGASNARWKTVYASGGIQTSSDIRMKENIEYVKDENAKARIADEVITYNDMYNFVKDDLELATYNFINQEEQRMNFIAQDLLVNKVGQMIIGSSEEGEEMLSYDMGMYISVLAGALKESLHQIEQLKARIDELENK